MGKAYSIAECRKLSYEGAQNLIGECQKGEIGRLKKCH